MAEIDYNQIGELILQKLSPVYVLDEETKQIIFTNKLFDDLLSTLADDETDAKALLQNMSNLAIAPLPRQTGDVYQWDYADKANWKLVRITNVWFENNGHPYRLGLVTDTTDFADLNRSVTDYFWLLNETSKLQLKMTKASRNIFAAMVEFFRDHCDAERVAISYSEMGDTHSVIADKNGVVEKSIAYASEEKPIVFSVSDIDFKFWIEGAKRAGAQSGSLSEDMDFMLGIAKMYIENNMLFRRVEWESCHDAMTQLYNRASLGNRVNNIYSSADSLGIICIDIDDLKKTNDTLGHKTGDMLIKKTAEVLLSVSNEEVHAFRMGGDEFMLVCINFTEEKLAAFAEEVLERVSSSNISCNGPLLSISLGKAFGRKPFRFDALENTADAKMYEVKRQKKNC